MSAGTRAQLGLCAVAVALFFPVLLLGETWIARDALLMHQPWRGHVLESLRAGHFPEWWDAVGLGTPVAANPLFGAVYPPMWLLCLVPAPLAVDLLFILHVLLAGAGVARLSARLGASPLGAFVGGAAFMAGGWASSMPVMGIPLLTAAWMPHLATAADRLAVGPRRAGPALELAALGALQIMAGDPAAVLATWLLCGIVILARAEGRRGRALAVAFAAAVAGALMAAILALPALSFLRDSERSGGLTTGGASVWSMSPWRLLEFVWPRVFGDEADARLHLARLFADEGARATLPAQFTPNLYVGLPVLLLAAVGARGRSPRVLLGGAAVLFLGLALGEHTPFYALWRRVFVVERIIRYPERHIVGLLVPLCAMAGAGFTRVFGPERRPFARVAAAGAVGLSLAVAAAALARGPLIGFLGDLEAARMPIVWVPRAVDLARAAGIVAAVVAWLFAAAAWLATRPRGARLAAPVAALLLIAHLVAADAPALATVSRAVVLGLPDWLAAPLAADLDAHRGGAPIARVFRPEPLGHVFSVLDPTEIALVGHESLADHTAPLFGVAETPGYQPAPPTREMVLRDIVEGPALERVLDLLDVRWALLPDGDGRARALREAAASPYKYRLLENPRRRPRGFVAQRWLWLPDAVQAVRALRAPELDFHAVRLEGSGPPPPAGAGLLTPCAVAAPAPERVDQRCRAPGPGYAVLLDAWSPGWSATLDGAPVPILRAEGLARAVAIPAGEHVIAWRYRAPGLRLGALVSAAAWAVWLLVALRARAAARRSGSPAP